jgi:hypothetical protein
VPCASAVGFSAFRREVWEITVTWQ